MSVMGNSISGLLEAMGRLGANMATSMEARMQRLRAAVRTEVRFAASAFALALAAAAFAVIALFFGAAAIMMAAWNTHPIMAAALIAMAFTILAVVAALLLRGTTR
jgi:multidrug efflux pump subunit AcrB